MSWVSGLPHDVKSTVHQLHSLSGTQFKDVLRMPQPTFGLLSVAWRIGNGPAMLAGDGSLLVRVERRLAQGGAGGTHMSGQMALRRELVVGLGSSIRDQAEQMWMDLDRSGLSDGLGRRHDAASNLLICYA